MATKTVLIEGVPYVVSEALARGLQDLMLTAKNNGYAALAVGEAGQVRYAHWLDTVATYEAVGAAWDALDKAQARIPARVVEALPKPTEQAWDHDDIPF